MATQRQSNNGVYGLYNPIQSLAPEPIIAKRNPTTADAAEFGTLWVNTLTNTYFIYTSAHTWVSSAAAIPVTNYTAVSTSPYVVQPTDVVLGVTTSSIAITIQLPNAPTAGRAYVVKDASGNANTHNITVTTVGGAVNIDGATSVTMNSSYESLQFLFNGTVYLIM
jgi:hypothetical protein